MKRGFIHYAKRRLKRYSNIYKVSGDPERFSVMYYSGDGMFNNLVWSKRYFVISHFSRDFSTCQLEYAFYQGIHTKEEALRFIETKIMLGA